MKRKHIPVEESFRRWQKEPTYRRAYEALEDEFVLAAALIDSMSFRATSPPCVRKAPDAS